MGLGAGFLVAPSQGVQAHHWRKRRPMAMGIVATGQYGPTSSLHLVMTFLEGAGFGGLIYPILLNQLINSSVGFAWAVRASAFLTLGLLFVANLIMTSRSFSAPGQAKPDVGKQVKVICTEPAFLWMSLG